MNTGKLIKLLQSSSDTHDTSIQHINTQIKQATNVSELALLEKRIRTIEENFSNKINDNKRQKTLELLLDKEITNLKGQILDMGQNGMKEFAVKMESNINAWTGMVD